MKKLLMLGAAVLVSATIGAGVAVAAVGDGGRVPNPPAEARPEGVVLAEAPSVRVAAFVNGGSTVGASQLVRSRGITSFANPVEGIFCLRSNVSGFHPSRVIPVVSIDYSLSTNNETDVQWRSSRVSCPSGNLEFFAFNQATGAPDNDASFTVIVP